MKLILMNLKEYIHQAIPFRIKVKLMRFDREHIKNLEQKHLKITPVFINILWVNYFLLSCQILTFIANSDLI